MQIFSYISLLFIVLEWTFSESYDITDNLPGREVEKKLNEYLDEKRNHRWRTLWRRMKPRFRACKTSRAEKIYLCGMVLMNDKYNVESLDNRYTHVCNTLTTTLLQQKYHLQMFPCRSKNMEQPDYYISKTGYNEVSPSLILLKGVEEEGYGYNIWVEARITLSKNDMTHMKMARGLERDQRFHQELHDLAVGLA